MKTTVYLTRHGQTVWNLEQRLQGKGDSPLTDIGINRAKDLAERLKELNIDVIYSSPIERAFHTAHIIRGDLSVEIIKETGLEEMGFGDYEGKTPDEIKVSDPKWDYELILKGSTDVFVPNGETVNQLRDRIKVSMDRIIDEHRGQNVLIVTHGMALNALMHYFKNDDGDTRVMGQVTLTKVEVDGDNNYNIIFKNDGSHFKK